MDTAAALLCFAAGVLTATMIWWGAIARWRGIVAEYDAALDRSIVALKQANENALKCQRLYHAALTRIHELDPDSLPWPKDGESRADYYARCGIKTPEAE